MVGCAAPTCNHSSRHGIYKFYRFPADVERRKLWIKNCKRENWWPTPNNALCNVHFEENQFEQNRLDGWVKLKPNAIPTIFDFLNEPKVAINLETATLKVEKEHFDPLETPVDTSIIKHESQDSAELMSAQMEIVKLRAELQTKNADLLSARQEIHLLRKQLQKKNEILEKMFTDEELDTLSKNKSLRWSDEGILKGFKLRFALGKQGYTFLHKSGYPCPSYSTLNRRVQDIKDFKTE